MGNTVYLFCVLWDLHTNFAVDRSAVIQAWFGIIPTCNGIHELKKPNRKTG
jgi:hypothetical protein